jgi:hypothetical protein
MTAKYWGRGPRCWTADLLRFDNFVDVVSTSSPFSPGSPMEVATPSGTDSRARRISSHTEVRPEQPSSLCCWSIHTSEVSYDSDTPTENENHQMGTDDEANWRKESQEPNIQDRLRDGLEANNFSNVKSEDLPVAVSSVLRSKPRSPEDLLLESISFSIIGRNLDLLVELLAKVRGRDADISGINPLHLATTYLDGGRTCCNILDVLICWGVHPRQYLDEREHTALDSLLVVILRAHTTCSPGIVDDVWKAEIRFPGEEVDICGRWDADSECIRTLFTGRNPKIPREWKHKFCHTSAQAICHCINAMSRGRDDRLLDSSSGLFLRRCEICGKKLQLQPLHAVVVVAFMLIRYGFEDEDLFGMIAVLLCLLQTRANPLSTAEVSISLLLREETRDCSHKTLTAMELGTMLQDQSAADWSESARIGWQILLEILKRSQAQWQALTSRQAFDHNSQNIEVDELDEFDELDELEKLEELDRHHNRICHFQLFRGMHEPTSGTDKGLGTIWAAVQTELLTYRRIKDGDPWNSDNFNMRALRNYLCYGGKLSIGLVEKQLMKPYCGCGRFEADKYNCAMMEHVSTQYFANLEDWSRITIIPAPYEVS